MAFDLMKFIRTGNGETAAAKPKPAATPSSTQKKMQPGAQRAVQKGVWQIDKMSEGDTLTYGYGTAGQDRWAEDQARAQIQQRNDEMGSRKSWSGADRQSLLQARAAETEATAPVGEGIFSRDPAITPPPPRGTVPAGNNGPPGHLPGSTGPDNTRQALVEQAAEDERASWASGLGGGTQQVRALTWDEYDALSPQQRAAVDANTMLIDAIKSDLARPAGRSDDRVYGEGSDYQTSLAALFGENGGSGTYAPATVAALEQLGLADTEHGDLDNYLNQSALVTDIDLQSIGSGEFSETARGQQAQLFSENALNSIASTLQSGYGMLSGVTAASQQSSDLNDLFEMLSSRSNFDTLADEDISEILGLFIQDTGIDGNTLTRYWQDRLNAYDYGTAAGQTPSLGSGDAAGYVSPAEFRDRYFPTGG